MKLLIDQGNSRIKWCWASAQDIGTVDAQSYDQTQWSALLSHHLHAAKHSPKEIWIASVANETHRQSLLKILGQMWPGVNPHIAKTMAVHGDIRVAYAKPERLGVDRFLALIAAHHAHKTACLIVSCGTAITVDALRANGEHLGGLIAPGPLLMREAMIAKAPGVWMSRDGGYQGFANNTEDAIESGCLEAAAGLIERAIARFASEVGPQFKALLSGGGAAALSPLLSGPYQLAPSLVLHGLRILANAKL